MSATATKPLQMLTISYRGAAIEARRPTHGECDLAWIERRLGILGGAQQAMRTETEKSGDGVSDRIDRLMVLADDAARALRKRLAPVARLILADGGAVAREIEQESEDLATVAAIDFAYGLLAALGVSGVARGKS